MAQQPPRRGQPDEWEVRDAADTMKRAHKIRKDKRMMRHVKKHVKREAADMQTLAQALGAGAGTEQPQSLGRAFGP